MSATGQFGAMRRALAEAGRCVERSAPGVVDWPSCLLDAIGAAAELEASGAMGRAQASITGLMAHTQSRQAAETTYPVTDGRQRARVSRRALLAELHPLPKPIGSEDRQIVRIFAAVAAAGGIDLPDLLGRYGPLRVVKLRRIAVYLCVALTGAGLGCIGQAAGGHCTTKVCADVSRVERDIRSSDDTARLVADILKRLGQTEGYQ